MYPAACDDDRPPGRAKEGGGVSQAAGFGYRPVGGGAKVAVIDLERLVTWLPFRIQDVMGGSPRRPGRDGRWWRSGTPP